MLAPALGLRPDHAASFLKAISEGTDVSAADKTTIDNQIKHHQIKIYVYNSQNVTPDVQAQISEAKAARIPIATITETLTPAAATATRHWQAGSCTASRPPWPQRSGTAAANSSRRSTARPMTPRSRPPGTEASQAVRFDARGGRGRRPDDLVRRDPAGRAGRVRRRARPERCRQVDADQGRARAARPVGRLGHRARQRPPDRPGGEIGYLPQRRSFDASLRSAGSTSSASALDGERWGLPCPFGDRFAVPAGRAPSGSTRSSTWSARPRTPTARSARSPAASSNAC